MKMSAMEQLNKKLKINVHTDKIENHFNIAFVFMKNEWASDSYSFVPAY